jgi:hypothetical protein
MPNVVMPSVVAPPRTRDRGKKVATNNPDDTFQFTKWKTIGPKKEETTPATICS